MNFVDALIQENPKIRIAVIDKDEPGGICLTRGCSPSKIMVYPAELVRTMEDADALGIEADVRGVSYEKIMKRMRLIIDRDIDAIKEGLSSSENIDYFHAVAEFVSPYTLKVEGKTVRGKMIFLGSGSRAIVPPIKGLDKVRYHTSDSIIRMELRKRPESIAIIGGGYIAAERLGLRGRRRKVPVSACRELRVRGCVVQCGSEAEGEGRLPRDPARRLHVSRNRGGRTQRKGGHRAIRRGEGPDRFRAV